MPKITMCTSLSCPIKDKCYRHTDDILIQSSFNFEYHCHEDSGFVCFIKKEEEECN